MGQDVGILGNPEEQSSVRHSRSRRWWRCCWKEFAQGPGAGEHTKGTAEACRGDIKCKPVSFEAGDTSTWLSQGGVLNTGLGQGGENKRNLSAFLGQGTLFGSVLG